MERALRISLPDGREVSALWTQAQPAGWAFVYAPGAGSNLNDPFGRFASSALLEAGVSCLRFQFPYSEARRPAPDRPEVLEAAWRSALATARGLAPRLVAGGRSMGGRIASQVVAQGEGLAGLALFAYPLHPPKRPEQRRDAHLGGIGMPVLFCSGDRDPYASVEELAALVAGMKDARLEVLAGADHGFATLKSSGRSRADVWRQAVKALLAFGQGLDDQ